MYFESRIMLWSVQYSEYARVVITLLTDVEFKEKQSNIRFPNALPLLEGLSHLRF
jgi:hypothetical protein